MEILKTAAVCEVKQSFEEVYKKYYPQILSYYCQRIGNHADAEDLTSEVFLYCANHYDNYDPQKASVATWIYLIAKSRFSNYCRDRKLTDNIDDHLDLTGDTGEMMDKALYLQELRERLTAALGQLAERQRQIVVWRYFDDRSIEEIANRLEITSNNVRVQLSRALKKLRSIIK